ncbi:MAG: hypothetical protein J6128_06005, partial [Clostridia bacterium]|nr:hypothetical protein [Clostridia bacterium]
MSEVFLRILNMSLTASFLILAVILVRLILRRAPKWIACVLWALVAVRLILPVSVESSLSLVPRSVSDGTAVERWAGSYVGELTYVSEDDPRYAESVGSGAVQVTGEDGRPYAVAGDGGTAPPETVGSSVVPVLSVIWASGTAVLLAYAFFSWIRLKRSVGASMPLKDGIFVCDEVRTPFILGVFRPKIYIPSSLKGADLVCVTAHETAHIKRRDHWWKPLGFLILAVHWFNPLCWIAYILLCRDIEMACDEKVVRGLDREAVAAYSQVLLDCSAPGKRIAACPLAFGEVGVRERVKNILNLRKPAFWIILAGIAACAVLAVCLMTNGRQEAPETPEDGFFSISYELGNTARHFKNTPSRAMEGETVEIRTERLVDAGIHVYADGQEINRTHFGSDYWVYSFTMPDRDVLVTARPYTKSEIWGTGDAGLKALKEKYPEYFGLSTFKGLEVYVWQIVPE